MSKLAPENSALQWKWWEPYVFTLLIILAMAAFLAASGVFGDILDGVPYGWPILFSMCTVAGVVDSFRRPLAASAVAGNLLFMLFFAAGALVYVTSGQPSVGIWYGVLAAVSLCLAAKAAVARRTWKLEQLQRLDKTVETVGQAFESSADSTVQR